MSAAEQVPGGSPGLDGVLDQALTWLRRSVGFDTARVLAYDPAVLIPVSIAASEPLPREHIVAACRNEQAEADVHKFSDLARGRAHVAAMTADSAEARQSPRWQNLILPDGFRHELRAAIVDDHGHCWGSVNAFRDGRRPFTGKDEAAVARELGQLATRLSRAMVAGAAAPAPGHAASLWLSAGGDLVFATPTGRELLDRLRTPEMPGRAETVLAGLAVRVAAGRCTGCPLRARPRSGVPAGRTDEGRWPASRWMPAAGCGRRAATTGRCGSMNWRAAT